MALSIVFDELKKLLEPFEKSLVCKKNDSESYYLDTTHKMKNKKNLFFGAVQKRKNYISYYLMPVYVEPMLLDGMSEKLKKRMHGKSCFNFKDINEIPLEELKELTEKGFNFYQSNGYI